MSMPICVARARARRSSMGWWVRIAAKMTPNSPKIAPDAPTEAPAVKMRLATDAAMPQMRYMAAIRAEP